jgi:CRP-like cAMP-binding protein
MQTELKAFISNYANINQEQLDAIAAKFRQRTINKNELLLQQGSVCRDLIFVQDGCLRLYYLADDVEISVWFAFKHSSAIELHSFISGEPSDYFLQAIEESTIWYLPKSELIKLYIEYPVMQEVMRKFGEDVILNLLERFTALQRKSAEQRYLDLLKKPAFMQKIPQKYLASFIGVTPTSLSRIRKNIR